MTKPTALITGASSGIGEELARIHAVRGGDLIVVARSGDKLEALKTELEQARSVSVHVIAMDLAQPDAARTLHAAVAERGLTVDYLINNAGFGGHGRFDEQDLDRYRDMINLNVLTLTALTRLYLPEMTARGRGRVLNVASMAGFLPGPLQAVYYATKAYVLSLSEAIANELSGSPVTVTALCPNATDTGFKDAANLEGARAFKLAVQDAREVAQAGYAGMERGETIVVPGAANKALVQSLRLMPRSVMRAISRATMEKG